MNSSRYRAVAGIASAVILAGGRSSRMGQPKATLRFGGITLIERTVLELARAFDDLVVVAAPESEKTALPRLEGARIVRDEGAYDGPVGALGRGLRAMRHEIAFACSCDLPMLRCGVAVWLISLMAGFDAVIPWVGAQPQLLHAVYSRRCAGALEAMIARGERRLGAIIESGNVRIVPESEYRSADPEAVGCFNINTPEDYWAALRLAGQRTTGSD
jgi:molybdopterin-guanine dinucleotide biosynthesis protein A